MASGDSDSRLDDLRARLVARREQMDRNSQAVADGTADPRVFEALKPAYSAVEAAPAEWRDMVRHDVEQFVTDEFDKAAAAGTEFDAAVVGEAAVAHVREGIETQKKARRSLSLLRRPSLLFDTSFVHAEIAAARGAEPEPNLQRLDVSTVKPWWPGLMEQNRHVIAALERLADNADEQKKVAPILFLLAVVGTIAAVVAAVAAVATVVLTA